MLNTIMINYLSNKKNINKEELNNTFNLNDLPLNLIKDFFNHYEELLELNECRSLNSGLYKMLLSNTTDKVRELYIWTLKLPENKLDSNDIYSLFHFCNTDKQIEVLLKQTDITLENIKEIKSNNIKNKIVNIILKTKTKNKLNQEDLNLLMNKALDGSNPDLVNTLLKNGYDNKINFEDIYNVESLKHIIKHKKLNEDNIIFNFKDIIYLKDSFEAIINSGIDINKIKYNLFDFSAITKDSIESAIDIYEKMLNKGFDFYNLDINEEHLVTKILDVNYLFSFKNKDLNKLNKILKTDLFEKIYYESNKVSLFKREDFIASLKKNNVTPNPNKEYDFSLVAHHSKEDFLQLMNNATNNYYLSSVDWNYSLIKKGLIPLNKIKLLKNINVIRNTHLFINSEEEYDILNKIIENDLPLSYVSKNNYTILLYNLIYGHHSSTKLLLENGYSELLPNAYNTPGKMFNDKDSTNGDVINNKNKFEGVEKINLEKYLLLKEYNILEKNMDRFFDIEQLQKLDLNYIKTLIEDNIIKKENLYYAPSENIDYLNPVVMKLLLLSEQINKTDNTFAYNVIDFLVDLNLSTIEDYSITDFKKATEFYINNGAKVDLRSLNRDNEEQAEIIISCYNAKKAEEENEVLTEIFIEPLSIQKSTSKNRL